MSRSNNTEFVVFLFEINSLFQVSVVSLLYIVVHAKDDITSSTRS